MVWVLYASLTAACYSILNYCNDSVQIFATLIMDKMYYRGIYKFYYPKPQQCRLKCLKSMYKQQRWILKQTRHNNEMRMGDK